MAADASRQRPRAGDVVVAWALIWARQRLIRACRIYVSAHATSIEQAKRIATLGRVFRYIASVIIKSASMG